MKILKPFLVIFLAYIAIIVSFDIPFYATQSNLSIAPTFTAKEFGKSSFYSSQKQFGKGPVVISFWATWCGPCIKELRALKPYYNDLSKKGVQFLAISIDDPKTSSRIKSVIKRYKLPYTILLDPDKHIFKSYQGKYPPLTVLINAKGEVVYKHFRYQKGDELVLIKKINQLLKKNTSEKKPNFLKKLFKKDAL